MSKRRVSYFYDTDVGSYTYGLGHPMKPHRIRMAHELVSAYNLLSDPTLTHFRSPRASAQQMTAFHTDEYIHFLSRVTPETMEDLTFRGTQFLVGDDNPAFEGVWEFCSISAGGSLAAAQRINSGRADIAINWAGGLHHAKKREASGFCYINDIVLAIIDLLRTFPRVLYVDIDCHHGDGVEEAFYTTERVMTCSFHKYGEYFPGTGTQEDRGRGKGRGYALNVPLKDGMGDETFKSVFDPILTRILEVFRPSVIVLQCGADSLSGDKLGCFNLSMEGHAHCTSFLREFNIPLVLLGGGGYTVKNVARAWCYETACALGVQERLLEEEMPWNEYFEWFGPRYRLEVVRNNMEDVNLRVADPEEDPSSAATTIPIPPSIGRGWKTTEIDRVRERALQQIKELETRIGAPSVQMMDVPREGVGEHVYGGEGDWGLGDDLDEKLAQHSRFVYHLQSQSQYYQNSSSGYRPSHAYHRRRSRSRSRSNSSSESASSLSDDEDERENDMYDSDHSNSTRRSTRSHSKSKPLFQSNNTGRSNLNPSTHPSSSSVKKRMSILTNSLFEVSLCSGDTTSPSRKGEGGDNPDGISFGSKEGKSGRRRFFFEPSTNPSSAGLDTLSSTALNNFTNGTNGTHGASITNGLTNGFHSHGLYLDDVDALASPSSTPGSALDREATEDLELEMDEDLEEDMMLDNDSPTPGGSPPPHSSLRAPRSAPLGLHDATVDPEVEPEDEVDELVDDELTARDISLGADIGRGRGRGLMLIDS